MIHATQIAYTLTLDMTTSIDLLIISHDLYPKCRVATHEIKLSSNYDIVFLSHSCEILYIEPFDLESKNAAPLDA